MAQNEEKRYLVATVESGILVICSSPVTANWVPRDLVNDAYNSAGSVPVGNFDSVEQAKRAAEERYPISPDGWEAVDQLPFDGGGSEESEIHTPEVDGHHIVRHGIHWK